MIGCSTASQAAPPGANWFKACPVFSVDEPMSEEAVSKGRPSVSWQPFRTTIEPTRPTDARLRQWGSIKSRCIPLQVMRRLMRSVEGIVRSTMNSSWGGAVCCEQ